jgi:hypothetical protein
MDTLTIVMADGGVLDWIGDTATEATNVAEKIAYFIVALCVLVAGIRSKWSIASILVSLLTGGLIVWGVTHPEAVADLVSNDLASTAITVPADPAI